MRGTCAEPGKALENNIQRKIDAMLKKYTRPELDADTLKKLDEILISRGVAKDLIDRLADM